MGIREQLRGRAGVREEDIDDIIEIAARLQDAQRDADEDARRVDALRKTAAELDIDPSFLDSAIQTLHQERAQAAEQAQQAAARRGLAVRAAAVAVGLAILLGGGVAASGASRVSAAARDAGAAAAQYTAVLDRQAALAPQLVALAGGDHAALQEASLAYQQASTLDEKRAASSALGLAMTGALAALPPATDEASAQARLNLQYELSGTQNRISTEQGRYQKARAAWADAAGAPGGRLAVGLGLAEAP